MSRTKEQADDLFSDSPRDKFLFQVVDFQNRLASISNPYVGNKRKMLSDIGLEIYDVFGTGSLKNVCDLFAGSSVVSAFFKSIGCKVSSNDLLASSYINGVALTRNPKYSLSKSEWTFLTKNENKNKSNFIELKYKDVRFTEKECVFIDNFFANCKEMFGIVILSNGNRGISDEELFTKAAVAHTSLIHFIMSYCFVGGRLNNGQVIAALKHRLEHPRNRNSAMALHLLQPFDFKVEGPDSTFSRLDVFDFLKKKESFDLVYIDPPYGGQQSDYAFMYQLFEEYLMQTEFDKIEYLSGTSAKFCKSKTYEENFKELLSMLPPTNWMISYNNSSWADIDGITSIVKMFKKSVTVKEINYSYKYRSADDSTGVEYLIVGQ